MRNLKKVLALVLAMVMALSLMTVASAVEFEDLKKATGKYQEAIKVLGALEVFKGYGEKDFAPERDITRAEVATIIYRIDTGDVGDKQQYLYVNNDFPDVKADHWAAGAIGYCVNKGIIKGYPDGEFKPSNKITGYEVLAMILREVGYDQKNEFSSNWPMTVASTARQVNASTTLTKADSNALTQPARREVVAELLFRTMVNAEMVYPNALWNYRTTNDLNPGANVNGVKDITLGEAKFKLAQGTRKTIDDWGRPGYDWLVGAKITWDSNANINGISGGKTISGGTKLVTMEEAYQAKYTTAVTECDVAEEVGVEEQKAYDLIINGQYYDPNGDQSDTTYTIVATNVVTKIGAQGRLTEVYKDRIIMIDTFLARVTKVSAPEFDKQNHVKTPARLDLAVYDNASKGYVPNDQTGTALYMERDDDKEYTYENGAKIAKGDVILINAYTSNTAKGGYADNADATSLGSVKFDPADNWDVVSNDTGEIELAEIVGKATEVANAKQTYIYLYTSQHEVGGKTYDDALTFYHDQAQNSPNAWTWYLDQYGNLIGSDPVKSAYDYGVITRLWWVNDSMGDGTAHVSVKYMDGTTKEDIKLSSLTMSSATTVGTTYAPLTGTPAYSVSVLGSDDILQILTVGTANKFYITTNWATNAEKSAAIAAAGRDGTHLDVIGGHLFRFQEDSTGVVSATEVAGDSQAGTDAAYMGLYNHTMGFVNNKPDVTGTNWTLRMDDHTQYLIRSGDSYSNYKYQQVTGLVNIGNYQAAEVDFVDVNGDEIAEYVYIIGAATDSSKEFLFYYNGDRIVQNVAEGTWTVHGYVDGEPGTITIANANRLAYIDSPVSGIRGLYEATMNSTYLGQLYQVGTTNGTVSTLNAVAIADNMGTTMDFGADTKADAYGGGTGYSVVRIKGTGTDNSFGDGTFWTYDTAGLLTQYRTSAGMKTPTGSFVTNMAVKDAILVYNNGNNNMIQAYIADVYDEEAVTKTVYSLDGTEDITRSGLGVAVTAKVQKTVNGTTDDYNANKKVTVTINYTYVNAVTGTSQGRMTQEVKVSELATGAQFNIIGMQANTLIRVSATVSNSDIGTLKIPAKDIPPV